MAAAVAAASLAVTAVSAYKQQQAASDAAKAQEEAQGIQQAASEQRARRQRRQQIRQERIRRARILQASENTGVTGSSSQIGSVGALDTNTGYNLGGMFSNTLGAQAVGQANQAAMDAQTKSNLWGGIGQISQSVFAMSGGFNSAMSLFGEQRTQQGTQSNFYNETFKF